MNELTEVQKKWIANHLEHYKGEWCGEYTKGIITGLLFGIAGMIAVWLC